LDQVNAINTLGTSVGDLSGSFDAAQAALKDAEGNIVDDFDTFFTNLQKQIEARNTFESNLGILRAFGLENLATVFADAGLEAAAALAGAVADPAKAAQAEAELTGQFAGVGVDLAEQIKAEITASGTTISTALVANLIDAAAAAQTPEVSAALTQLAAYYSGLLHITPTIDPVMFSGEALKVPRAPSSSFAQTPGGGLVPSTQVVINNPTTQDLNTDAARAAQVIGSVTNAQ
jgi:hypothetical protein